MPCCWDMWVPRSSRSRWGGPGRSDGNATANRRRRTGERGETSGCRGAPDSFCSLKDLPLLTRCGHGAAAILVNVNPWRTAPYSALMPANLIHVQSAGEPASTLAARSARRAFISESSEDCIDLFGTQRP